MVEPILSFRILTDENRGVNEFTNVNSSPISLEAPPDNLNEGKHLFRFDRRVPLLIV